MSPAVRSGAAVIAVLTLLRAYAAFTVPLTGDEAYYWTWSLHPAYGYTDHPPLVAWLIALGRSFGSGAGFVRLPFVLCEAVAACAIGRAAFLVSANVRAGVLAAVIFALIPQTKLAIGEALPDGAYMAAWALALWATAALDRRVTLRTAAALGLALAACVLARTFGWALVAGVLAWSCASGRRARLWPPLLVTAAIVVALYAPFLVWNAAHGWENIAFTFHGRQELRAFAHLTDPGTLRFLAYAVLLTAVTWFVALRRSPRVTLVAWTALPLPFALFVMSFVTTTESYWIIGPAASVALGAGIALEGVLVWRRIVIGLLAAGTVYATLTALFLTLPQRLQARVFAAAPALRGPLASGVYVYAPLAERVRALSANGTTAIFTDRYETAAELLWYGLDSRIIVAIPQSAQWARWHVGEAPPQHALLVTYRGGPAPALAGALRVAFARVTPLRELTFQYAGVPEDAYGVTQLDMPLPDAARVLAGL
jgi:4-amino-4-deoxy-L-arabinose transferase-like glycosyltransferase